MDWGEDTVGAEAQHPDISPVQFKKANTGKDLTVEEHAHRVNNIINSYNAGTPAQKNEGAHFYPSAHRAAVTIANGEAPGIIPKGKRDTPAIKRGVYRKPGVTQGDVERVAGAIARMSPSSPAGMTWEENAQAVHELGKMSPERVDRFAAGQRGSDVGSVNHAGGDAAVRAKNVLEGHVSYDEDLNMKKAPSKKNPDRMVHQRAKTGSFAANIINPRGPEATIDGRSHDIATGAQVGWTTNRGLKGGRYNEFEAAHQEAAHVLGKHVATVQAGSWIADKEGQKYARGAGTGRGRKGNKPVGQ